MFGTTNQLHMFGFSNDPDKVQTGKKNKDKMYSLLHLILAAMGIKGDLNEEGPIRTHSACKYM